MGWGGVGWGGVGWRREKDARFLRLRLQGINEKQFSNDNGHRIYKKAESNNI